MLHTAEYTMASPVFHPIQYVFLLGGHYKDAQRGRRSINIYDTNCSLFHFTSLESPWPRSNIQCTDTGESLLWELSKEVKKKIKPSTSCKEFQSPLADNSSCKWWVINILPLWCGKYYCRSSPEAGQMHSNSVVKRKYESCRARVNSQIVEIKIFTELSKKNMKN